jgi:16S rRNA (cytosine967-C5)-methyltransferase
MKLYKNLINSMAFTLQEIFLRGRYADKSLEKLFKKNPQWGSRDRRFVAEGIYDIVRNYRLYAELAESDRNFWFITAVWLSLKNIEIPQWQEFRDFDANRVQQRLEDLKSSPKLYYSYPDWLWKLCAAELTEESWLREAIAMHSQAPVFLRANSLKTDAATLCRELQKDGIGCELAEGSGQAVKLSNRVNVFSHRLFKEGWFEVQDIGSQRIAEFLDPVPGDTVVDACAGAGGKSLHISSLTKNKGRVISLDVEDYKLEELKKRARRAGAFNIESRLIDSTKTIKALASSADKVLLDVPCSGLGVLKRNPDTKWKLTPESIDQTKELQKKIISEYSSMVKPGGTLVYSTCSILPSENQAQVDWFLAQNSSFEKVGEVQLRPNGDNDGFYMAKLKKTTG